MQHVLRIRRLSVTPVKSLSLHSVDSIELTATGAPDDRRFFLVDERQRIVNGVRCRRLSTADSAWDGRTLTIALADGTRVAGVPELGEPVSIDWELGYRVAGRFVDNSSWNAALSELAGRPVRLVRADDARPAWSAHPVSLIGAESIATLRADPLGSSRFRMLVEFSGGAPFVEDSWVGARVAVGDATVVVRKRCTRCATTTREPETGERDFDTLRTLLAVRGAFDLGVYCDVERPGRISVGDHVNEMERASE